MFIYIVKNKIAFYDDPEDYTAKKLYKKLLKEYGCEPVIIKLEPDENNEFAVTAEITPAPDGTDHLRAGKQTGCL